MDAVQLLKQKRWNRSDTSVENPCTWLWVRWRGILPVTGYWCKRLRWGWRTPYCSFAYSAFALKPCHEPFEPVWKLPEIALRSIT